MERVELAHEYHKKDYNCCQSVLAAFSDITGLSEQASMNIGGGKDFGDFNADDIDFGDLDLGDMTPPAL